MPELFTLHLIAMKQQLLIILLCGTAVLLRAQSPRNASGLFEYSQFITQEDASTDSLNSRAKKFFTLPFLVHWDTVYATVKDGAQVQVANGYVEIELPTNLWGSFIRVGLQFLIFPSGNGYYYAIRHLKGGGGGGPAVFPLEEKPNELKGRQYEQLLARTHRYITGVIGYMKQEMSGQEY